MVVAWIYTRSSWTQQGSKLIGSDRVPGGDPGSSVALSADGITAMVGGPGDNSFFNPSSRIRARKRGF
jgi:hypothetical protein